MTENKRCRVETALSVEEPVASITPVFECANWFEREF